MRTARAYIAREVYKSSSVILLALVGLFMLFALIEGLDKIGERLSLLSLFYLQLLDLPNYLYELLPIGLLIGAVLALAGLAQRNELTILRASGVSGMRLLFTLWLITAPMMLGAWLLSEYITPAAELRGSESRLAIFGRTNGGHMSSGYWFKEADPRGGTRVINIKKLASKRLAEDIIIYEFTPQYRLHAYIQAKQASFDAGQLVLQDLIETTLSTAIDQALKSATAPAPQITRREELAQRSIPSSLTPERLIARVLTPERMSISDLLDYIGYLKQNNLQTDRQEVALWRKIAYPFTLLVMVTIAAPVGFMQTRRGGVGPKVFIGIILGVLFFMLNQLALNAGMLGDWAPWATALVPSLLGLLVALLALITMEHSHPLSRKLKQLRIKAS